MTLELKDGQVTLDGRPLNRVYSIDVLNIGLNRPMEAVIRMNAEIPDIDPEDGTEVEVRVPLNKVNVEYDVDAMTKVFYGMN
ncbi:MAG: hypothetical protein LUH03_09690 [Oscillospiraceae bacterium]|nr:hypothetical protein [Oscillospiraceae bacterium]